MKLLFFLLLLKVTLFSGHIPKKTGLEKMIQPKISLDSGYISDASISGYKGSVLVRKNRLSINNKIAGFSYTNWNFIWNRLQSLPFGNGISNPIKHMHRLKVNANIPYFLNKKWFLLSSLSLKSTFEKETDNSYSGGFFSFASYKLDNEHSIAFGAFANYHPISTFSLPVLSYSYRASQNKGFKFILGFPRTYIGYHINKKLLLRFGSIFSQSIIRLSDKSTIEESGFIEAKDYMGNFGLSYEIDETINIQTDLICSIKRDVTVYSKNGNKLNSYWINPSLGLNFRVTYIF